MFYNKTLLRKRTLKLLKRNQAKIGKGKINIYTCRVFMNYASWLKHIKSRLLIKFNNEIKIAKTYISKYDLKKNKI